MKPVVWVRLRICFVRLSTRRPSPISRLAKRLLPFAAAIPLACVFDALCVATASAHVKWFCAYDVAGQPEGLENVLCPDFEFLIGLSVLALMTGAVLEGSVLGAAVLRSLDRVTRLVRDNLETIFRAGCAFFFIAIWGAGGILLTPELKTSSALVGAIQLGIAAGMLSRRTMPLSAAGIFVLFGIGTWEYGVFHLADYPIFSALPSIWLWPASRPISSACARSTCCAGPPGSR